METKSGADFARGPDDWKPFNDRVYDTLRRLHAAGYKICIFRRAPPPPPAAPRAPRSVRSRRRAPAEAADSTTPPHIPHPGAAHLCRYQNGITGALTGKTATTKKGNCDAFLTEARVPATAVFAPQQDGLRKPRPGMWCALRPPRPQAAWAQTPLFLCAQPHWLNPWARKPSSFPDHRNVNSIKILHNRDLIVSSYNGGVSPDLSMSFFVGDTAGRAGDHSDADRRARTPRSARLRPSLIFSRAWDAVRWVFLPPKPKRSATAASVPRLPLCSLAAASRRASG